MIQETVGERLKRLREAKGLGLKQTARLLGCTKACVNYWENDTHQPGMLWLLCLSDLYGASIDYIVRGYEYEKK